MRALNERFPLKDILGDERVTSGVPPLWAGLFPENIQGSLALAHIVRASVQAGSWQPSIIDFDHGSTTGNAQHTLEQISVADFKVYSATDAFSRYGEALFGAERVRREGLVSLI